jgi:glutaminase
VLANARSHLRLVRQLEEGLAPEQPWRLLSFPSLDPALEWAENQLLASRRALAPDVPLPLAAHPICRGLSEAQVERLEKLLEPMQFAAGDTIVRKGEPADRIYFLVDGEVSVLTDLANGELTRLSTLSRGMTFGELAAVSREARSADVRADAAAACFALPVATFERLAESDPDIKLVLLENLLAGVSQTVARLTHEVAALAQ